jgi:hypothetical protein
MTRVRLVGMIVGAALAVTVAGAGYLLGNRPADPSADSRQAEVADRGAEVMPFDLDRTTHVFTGRPDGGTQTVTADDPRDAGQVRLIREHLRTEAAAFAQGDFTDPATIHGDGMPGLATLRAGTDRITVRYRDLPAGGQLTYTTDDQALVDALHDWFAAQVTDHGEHAGHG